MLRYTVKYILSILVILLNLYSCASKGDRNENLLLDYLEANHLSPEKYVIEKFKSHDVIFMGENHFIKQQVDFIKELIPHLYENRIYYLGTEFLNYEHTETINQIITAESFDERKVQEISMLSTWHWGYQEYIDIYRAAWQLNKNLPENAQKFKIFGIQEKIDFSYIQTEEDYNKPEIMRKVFPGLTLFEEEEGYSAHAIQHEVIDIQEKALIHCGIHHAFTSYYQPNYDPVKKGFGGRLNKERMGNLIRNKIGDRTMTIFLHGPWYSEDGYDEMVLPVEGVLDSLFSIAQYKNLVPFGVDTKGTPFGNLTGENSVYKYGYENFTLKDFCDGYIFLMPINNYQHVTTIPDFVRAENVEYIKSQEFDYRSLNLSAKDLNDTITVWLEKGEKNMKALK